MPDENEERESEDDAEEEEEEEEEQPEKKEVRKKIAASSDSREGKAIKAIEERGKVLHQCPYPGCNFKHPKAAAVYGHITFRHYVKGEYLDASGKTEKRAPLVIPGASPSALKTRIRREMYEEDRKGKARLVTEDGASERADSGKKAEIKGRLRLLLKNISEADPDQRDALMPTREVLMDYIKVLSKEMVSESEVEIITNKYEDTILPEVETVLGRERVARITRPGPPAVNIPKLGIITRIAKLRGTVKQYISSIAKVPPSKRDELSSERETLSMLNQRLLTKDMPEEELAEMENIVESEIRPAVDAAILATQKSIPQRSKEASSDDIMSSEIQHKKEELDLRRVDRMIAEESVRHKDTLEAMRGSAGGRGSLVPVMRPMMDETGEVKKDKDGKPVMETTYAPVEQAGSMNNLMMTMLLSGKLGGGDSAMAAILPAILDNNTKVLVAMLANKKSDGPSAEEIILKVQNENMKMMMEREARLTEAMKPRGEDPNLTQLREELRATREIQISTQSAMHRQQLEYVQREMEDLKRYAYRDSTEELLKQKTRLEQLGIVSSTAKDTETKALEKSTEVAKDAMSKFDKNLGELKTLIQPFADAQGAILRSQIQPTRPLRPSYTEEQKKAAYKKILEQIEGGEEEHGGEEG